MASDHLALVTGAPGWLGNRLLRHLHQGHPDYPADASRPQFARLRCLVQPGADASALTGIAPDVELVEGDIRDPDAARRFCDGAGGATVFHLAGLIHPRRRVRELFEVNVEGTRNLLAAATGAGIRRVVATSSNSPLGYSRDPEVRFDESSPYRPYLGYGRSKMLMERDLNAAGRDGRIETVIVRPCWFYGPEQPERQTTFFRMIRSGRAPIVGGGGSRRSMSYVESAALGLLLAGARPEAAGETYWIADQRPYSMNEIVDTVENVLERDFSLPVAHKRMKLPSVASEVAYAADAMLQRAGLYQQKLHVLSEMNKTIACSIEKARRELGYEPKVELREGMRRSIEWCLARGDEL